MKSSVSDQESGDNSDEELLKQTNYLLGTIYHFLSVAETIYGFFIVLRTYQAMGDCFNLLVKLSSQEK